MKIRPKKNRDRSNDGMYCGRCGVKVPFEAKYLTEYFQIKVKNVNVWIVSIGYICPKCVTPTRLIIHYLKDQSKIIKRINLYGIYEKNHVDNGTQES